MSNSILNKQAGFAHALIFLVIFIGIAGLIGWRLWAGYNQSQPSQTGTPSAEVVQTGPSELIWQQAEGGWRSTQTPPACPDPLMKMPADISKVTSILYPGQTRGGNYKPHGGFRFDGTANDKVTVTAPVDGFIVRGGHYLAEGEIQYTFDIMNNCGVMYRVGHFRALPPTMQQLTKDWPQAVEGDSRTHQVNPPVYVKQGETLATSVGIVAGQNTFFDWGVYDYRAENEASKSASYKQAHASDKELSWHAVCWFDWLPASDASKVKSLPGGDPFSGKTSDYCR